MPAFASSTVDALTPSKRTPTAPNNYREASPLTDMTNRASHTPTIARPDEITPLGSPNTVIIDGTHCLLNRLQNFSLHDDPSVPEAPTDSTTFPIDEHLAAYCANFTEKEVASAILGMRKGPPGFNHLNLRGLDIAHLTRLINLWWNNKPMGISAAAVTLIKKTKPAAPKLNSVPYSEPILTAPKKLTLHPCTTNHEDI